MFVLLRLTSLSVAIINKLKKEKKKEKNTPSLQSSNCTVGDLPKDSDAMKRGDTCTPMFIAATSTIAKMWKEAWSPLKDEWIKKMWFMYTMEYYSAIRNDKYPPFASTGMELEGIMLSKVCQSEKDKHVCSHSFGEYK